MTSAISEAAVLEADAVCFHSAALIGRTLDWSCSSLLDRILVTGLLWLFVCFFLSGFQDCLDETKEGIFKRMRCEVMKMGVMELGL